MRRQLTGIKASRAKTEDNPSKKGLSTTIATDNLPFDDNIADVSSGTWGIPGSSSADRLPLDHVVPMAKQCAQPLECEAADSESETEQSQPEKPEEDEDDAAMGIVNTQVDEEADPESFIKAVGVDATNVLPDLENPGREIPHEAILGVLGIIH